MRIAARAIVIESGKILVMHRNKFGSQYFTLVGGKVAEGESPEHALVREVKEETGLNVTAARLVYFEEHAAPHNEQYIYLCQVGPHDDIAVQDYSEEGSMNKYDMNTHEPHWVTPKAFAGLSFRTPQLQAAIIKAFKQGFPTEAEKI